MSKSRILYFTNPNEYLIPEFDNYTTNMGNADLQKIAESLFVMRRLKKEIMYLTEALESLLLPFDEPLQMPKVLITCYLACCDQIAIKAVAFLDEYNKMLVPKKIPSYEKRIGDVKLICKPVSQEIHRLWPDLKEFRNQFVAHNFRDKQGKLVYNNIASVAAPMNYKEIVHFAALIMAFSDIVLQEFNSEVQLAEGILGAIDAERKGIDYSDGKSAEFIERIVSEVNLKCIELGKTYRLFV